MNSKIGYKTGACTGSGTVPETEQETKFADTVEDANERELLLQLATRRIQAYILKYLNGELYPGLFLENINQVKRQFIDNV